MLAKLWPSARTVGEPGRPQPRRQGPGQTGVGQVAVPGAQHPPHASGIGRVPGHRRPVDVPDDQAAARAQGPAQLGQGGVHLAHVLQHLHRQGGVEAGVGDRQVGGVRLVELDVVGAIGAPPGQGQGLGAGVDADHPPGRPHLHQQLGHVEAGAAADVQDPLAGRAGDGLADQPPPAQHVAGAVQGLELAGQAVVEHQLGHGVLRLRTGAPAGAWSLLPCWRQSDARSRQRWRRPVRSAR